MNKDIEAGIVEAEVKAGVEQYLQLMTNQGKIYADRLNSGEVVIVEGSSRRRINLCKEGTADFFFIKWGVHSERGYCRVVFIECKRPVGGVQSPAQQEFAINVIKQGAEYHIVKTLDEVIELVEGKANDNNGRG